MPFIVLPFTSIFAASINLYWCFASGFQLIIISIVKRDYVIKNILKIPEYYPNTFLEEEFKKKNKSKIII